MCPLVLRIDSSSRLYTVRRHALERFGWWAKMGVECRSVWRSQQEVVFFVVGRRRYRLLFRFLRIDGARLGFAERADRRVPVDLLLAALALLHRWRLLVQALGAEHACQGRWHVGVVHYEVARLVVGFQRVGDFFWTSEISD